MKKLFAMGMLLALAGCRSHYPERAIPFGNSYVLHTASGNMTVETKGEASRGKGDRKKYYYWLRRDSVHHSQGAWHGRLLDGPYTLHRPDGSLKEMGRFADGLKVGAWYHWDGGGTLRRRSTWRGGLESGRFWVYGADGALQQRGRMKGGKVNGRLKDYLMPDSLRAQHYRDGEVVVRKRDGPWTKYRKKLRKYLHKEEKVN